MLYLHSSLPEAAPQCISGRTSYFRVRLAFYPYPQLILQFCLTERFGPPRDFTRASPWPWVAHSVSGLIHATFQSRSSGFALFGLAFALAPHLQMLNQATQIKSPAHSSIGTPSQVLRELQSEEGRTPLLHVSSQDAALTACKHAVSGSISLPSRGAFHLSLTVLVHYRSSRVFSLGGWSPQLPTGFHVSRGTQGTSQSPTPFAYRTITFYGGSFQRPSTRISGL